MNKIASITKNAAKVVLRPFIRAFLMFAPPCVIENAVSIRPALIDYLPSNRKFVFKKYLGDISVNVDTVYRIEREMLTGHYDKETLYVIDKYVKSGDTCFDIGANVGPVTFALAKKVRPNGKVFAFEPGSVLYQRLRNNIKLNPSYGDIISAYKIGFSDKKETLAWNEDKNNRGNAGFLLQESNQEEKIDLITVDEFVRKNDVGKIDFMKIDVEGMEYEVVKGSINTIKKYKPVLYYETGFFEKRFWAEVIREEQVVLLIEDFLKDLGYNFYKLDKERIIETHYPDLSYNTLAIMKG